jgi:hypothetical protein
MELATKTCEPMPDRATHPPHSRETAKTPSRGGAKEFVASIERQRAQIATIAKTLGIQPTR